ncbi:hypothetical protein CHS0354_012478 [Potamilus streckersoni]|uniref:Uncharacterized protein n=1 Tax=Potamilus streckersoni TaxID=2493646 RepID=A0AAE0S068_9BIVA|nr:hypothetical protein CHS0354_012478 [Potamilus streckersoni]
MRKGKQQRQNEGNTKKRKENRNKMQQKEQQNNYPNRQQDQQQQRTEKIPMTTVTKNETIQTPEIQASVYTNQTIQQASMECITEKTKVRPNKKSRRLRKQQKMEVEQLNMDPREDNVKKHKILLPSRLRQVKRERINMHRRFNFMNFAVENEQERKSYKKDQCRFKKFGGHRHKHQTTNTMDTQNLFLDRWDSHHPGVWSEKLN